MRARSGPTSSPLRWKVRRSSSDVKSAHHGLQLYVLCSDRGGFDRNSRPPRFSSPSSSGGTPAPLYPPVVPSLDQVEEEVVMVFLGKLKSKEHDMLQVTMVGASFRPASAKEALKQLAIGDKLELRADPDNQYDTTAVACYYAHHHLGFIPRDSNSALFAVLMDGAEISAEIIAFETTLKPVLEIHFDSMPADDLDESLEIEDMPHKPGYDYLG